MLPACFGSSVSRRLRAAQRVFPHHTGDTDPVAAGLAKLRDPGPDGGAVRDAVTAALS